MKEIKIIQDDEGMVSVETTDAEGNPTSTPMESVEDALEIAKAEFGGVETEPMESEEMPSPSAGKKLEDNIPMPEEDEIGVNAKKKPDWSKYGAI